MRKALAFFLVTVLSLMGVNTFIAFSVNSEKDNVVYNEEVIYGDKSFVKGLTVDFKANYEGHLFWNTEYTFGDEDIAKTEFDFKKNYTNTYLEEDPYYISVYSDLNYSFDSTGNRFFTDNTEYTGITKAYKELWEEAEPGVTARKIIFYKDYYDYYPFSGDMRIRDDRIEIGYNPWDLYDVTKETVSLTDDLEAFFKVPVLEDDCREIHLTKTEGGEIHQLGSSMVSEDYDSFHVSFEGVESGGNFFIVFSNRTYNGKIVDTSLIPGGYGIYSFLYSYDENTKNAKVDFKNIKMVYAVDEENEIINITTSTDKSKLHLITREAEGTVLTVIDALTLDTLQRLIITENPVEHAYVYETSESFIVYEVYDKLAVVTIDESGHYNREFLVKEQMETEDTPFIENHKADFHWNGQNLFSVFDLGITLDFGKIRCGFGIACYNKDGLTYFGEYDSSLNTGEQLNYSSGYYCYANHYGSTTFKLN